MRAYRERIVYLDAHLRRIQVSCKIAGLSSPNSSEKLKKIIFKAIKKSGFSDAYVKLLFYKSKKNTGRLLIIKKYQPHSEKKYQQGLRACVSELRQDENYVFARIKSTNRLLFESSFLQAKKKGFDEAIILNSQGYIAEASRSNIFWAKDRKLFTPSLECGCLNGITRKVVLGLAKKYKIKIKEGKFRIKELLKADGAFLTSSLIGIMPLVGVGKKQLGKGSIGRITGLFMEKYNFLLKKQKPRNVR